MNGLITGEHLKIARLIYGYPTQESLAKYMNTTPGTIQRYEALDQVSAKIIGEYEHRGHFDLLIIFRFIEKARHARAENG